MITKGKIIFLFVLVLFGLSSSSQIKNDSIIINPPDTAYQNTRDSIGIFTKVGKEATYPGGVTVWRNFLEQNLDVLAAIRDLPTNKKHYRKLFGFNLLYARTEQCVM